MTSPSSTARRVNSFISTDGGTNGLYPDWLEEPEVRGLLMRDGPSESCRSRDSTSVFVRVSTETDSRGLHGGRCGPRGASRSDSDLWPAAAGSVFPTGNDLGGLETRGLPRG